LSFSERAVSELGLPEFEPLTVVICLDHASVVGGLEKAAIESAIGLKRAGARPILFAAVGPADRRLAEAGVEVVCLGQRALRSNPSRAAAACQGVWNSAAAAALARLLDDTPPDRTIVHVHGWTGALSPSIVAPMRAAGRPAIHTIHDYSLFCPNGGFYDYQREAVCPVRPLSCACLATHCDSRTYARKLWRFGRLYAARRWLGMATLFSDHICVSRREEEIVKPLLPPGARLHRLSNPIDAADLGPKTDPASGELIFVGRLMPEKGASLFAEAASRVGAAATFVGDGRMAETLKRKFPQARFLGWLPPEQARAQMRAARALVFPSLWYEAQGLTVLEAKALGTPVIVSDVCAGRDEIEDGVSGLWFKSGDVDALAAALERIRDDSLVARLSRAAYESYWRAPATLEAHVAGLQSIYAEALSRPRGAAAPARPQ
jgi:glycosyltransferase involved in cell wall biosynthesis